jgi:hypothetical protein
MAKTKKKTAKKPKAPHCKILKDAQGNTKKTAAGKTKKMCFGSDGKITSEANVKAYRARKRKKAA